MIHLQGVPSSNTSQTNLFPLTFHITFSSCGKFQAAKAATILWQQRTFWTIHLRFISCYFPLDICRSLHNQAARNLRAVPASTIHTPLTPAHIRCLHFKVSSTLLPNRFYSMSSVLSLGLCTGCWPQQSAHPHRHHKHHHHHRYHECALVVAK